jgi:hypothetical protein
MLKSNQIHPGCFREQLKSDQRTLAVWFTSWTSFLRLKED